MSFSMPPTASGKRSKPPYIGNSAPGTIRRTAHFTGHFSSAAGSGTLGPDRLEGWPPSASKTSGDKRRFEAEWIFSVGIGCAERALQALHAKDYTALRQMCSTTAGRTEMQKVRRTAPLINFGNQNFWGEAFYWLCLMRSWSESILRFIWSAASSACCMAFCG